MRRIILFLLLITGVGQSMAQVTNYDFFAFRTGNMFSVNPAWVTKDEGINVILNSQVMGTTQSFGQKNLMAGVYSQVGNKSGLGTKIITDSRGAFQTLHADVSYGFNAQFSDKHGLRMGLLAGLRNSSFNINRLESHELIDLSDPTLGSNHYNNTQFLVGAGIVYNYQNLDVMASIPQIVSTSQVSNAYINTAVSYKIVGNNDFTFQPWVSYQNIPVTKSLVGGYVKSTYKDLLWAQVGYQSNKSTMGAVGVIYENIGLSYGFRLSNPDVKQVAGGALHEITFALRIVKKKSKLDAGLQALVSRLDHVLSQEVTSVNRVQLRNELNEIRKLLSQAEIDNSNPKKAKLVEEQLNVIEEKIRIIEKRLYP
jgi:type IX secretion system PorP/SprF family membrane protein